MVKPEPGSYENVDLILQPADYTCGIYDETGNAEVDAYRFLFNTGSEAIQVGAALGGTVYNPVYTDGDGIVTFAYD